MQDQNFEEKVRQRLQGLLIEPSQPVWAEVEKELASRKKRRRFVFLLALLVPACTGIALYVGQSFRTAPKGGRTTVVTATSEPTAPATTSVPAGDDAGWQPSSDNAGDVPGGKHAPVDQPVGSKSREGSPLMMKNKTDIRSSNQYETSLFRPIAREPIIKRFTAIDDALEKRVPGTDPLSFVRNRVYSVDAQKKEATVQQTRAPFSPSFHKLPQGGAPTAQRKWVWSLHASLGWSMVRSSLFHGAKAVRADFQTGSVAGAPPPGRTPSLVNHGGVYTIGADMRKLITRKLSLMTGLHYRRAQTRVTVGATVGRDTTVVNNSNSFLSVSAYYNTGAAQKLTNNYHFLELPLALEWQPFQRVPLRLQGSITGARMIATDAVLFGMQNRVYYKDKGSYHNTQFYIGTGVDYRLMRRKGFALRAGPYLHYSLTTLEKRGFVDHHLFATGIRTNISF